jgi:glycosyltransferase involved in cell wall biosynthesis
MKPIRILELRSVWGTGGGPEKTILLGTARTDPRRFAITVCYLRDRRDPVFSIDNRAASLPVNYIEVIERHSFDPDIWTQLRRIVRDHQIDIVHAHDYKTNVLAALLQRVEGVAAMSTVHGWTGHSRRERYFYYPLDKYVLGTLRRVVAVSEDIRQELLKRGADPTRVRTVLNGIDHRAFHRDHTLTAATRRELGLSAEDVVIGSVGRLEPQKRFDLLIDAVNTLRRREPRLKLVIAGDGSLRADIAAHVTRLGLSNACRLLGHRDDVTRLHHAFDLYVQSSDYEGTPNSVLEAMAMESPVIATAAGGTAQLIRHDIDGVIVPIGGQSAIIAAIEHALANPDAAARWAASARRRVETDLSFDTRMAMVEAVYLELMALDGRADDRSAQPLQV